MGIVYSKTKIFHFKDKLYSLLKTNEKVMAPVHVRIKPTNICCHSCSYCAYGKDNFDIFGKDKIERCFIPKERLLDIIDDLVEIGTKAVTFSGGGEPLMYPYLIDALKKLCSSGMKFATLTNGALLKGNIADIFSNNGTWIRVSMDGWDDKSYSEFRRVRDGEFTRIISNMRDFKKRGGNCYLGVSLIVSDKNAPHVYEILKVLEGIGVDSVKISPCLVNDTSADNNSYHRPFFHIVRQQVDKAIEELSGKKFEIFNAYIELDEKFKKDYDWCPYLQILPIIGADLNIYACPDKAYNLKNGMIGTIKNQRFKDFWFSDKNNFFKINPSEQCDHHCETNQKNKLVLEYLSAYNEHLDFV